MDISLYPVRKYDQIVSGAAEVVKSNKVITIPVDDFETITEIQMKSAPDSKKLKRLTPKEVLYEGSREIQLPQAEQPMESYYVYGPDGDLLMRVSCWYM